MVVYQDTFLSNLDQFLFVRLSWNFHHVEDGSRKLSAKNGDTRFCSDSDDMLQIHRNHAGKEQEYSFNES